MTTPNHTPTSTTELTMELRQARMLAYAEATKTSAGWLACGMGQAVGGGEKDDFDACKVSVLGHENRDSFYFAVDATAHVHEPSGHMTRTIFFQKKDVPVVRRTALFHLAEPIEPDKLIPFPETAEDFTITTLAIDDTGRFPLKAIHDAHIGHASHPHSGDIVDYLWTLDGGYTHEPNPRALVELDWALATEADVARFDGIIERSLDNLKRIGRIGVFDYAAALPAL